jgi:hypothetical protein
MNYDITYEEKNQDKKIDKKTKIEITEAKIINDNKKVSAIIQNNRFVDITFCERKNVISIKKINATQYIKLNDKDEIKYTFKKNKTKTNDNLKKTFAKLKYDIRHNFSAFSNNQLMITVTYKENMQDERRLMKDIEKFIKKLRYKCKNHILEYILIPEPQERGAWHCHIMIKSNKNYWFIKNKIIAEMWGHGFTNTARLKSDDIGAYYVAYFTDLMKTDVEGNNKIKKGGRLHLYPVGMKIYRKSRGIKKPPKVYMNYGDIVKKFGQPKNKYAFLLVKISDEGTKHSFNFIQKEHFKLEEIKNIVDTKKRKIIKC